MSVDPFFNEVVLLLHCEGSDGSTTFTDSSKSAKTITANGNAKISTTQSKWGNGSGYLDGQDSPSTYLSVADSVDWHFAGAYTIEIWLYIQAYKATNFWFVQQSDGSGGFCPIRIDLNASGIVNCLGSSDNASWVFSAGLATTTALSAGTWYHLALCDDGSNCRLFLNGVQEASRATWSKTNIAQPLMIGGGYSGGDREFYGYIQDFRITNGAARYTANFTPPTAILPDVLGHFLPTAELVWTAQSLNQSGALIKDFLPASSLTWTAQPLIITPVLPAESLTWASQTLGQLLTHDLPASTLTWTSETLTNGLSHSLSVSSLTWTASALQFIIESPGVQQARNLYRAYLTGSDEDPPVADLELPLASWQSTRRNAEQTYLYIVVPNPVPYIDGINARLNGDIVIYSGFAVGDTETLTELLRVNFESFRYDLGVRSGSAQLSGHKQVTYSNPKTRALSGISYKSVTDGIRRVRCEPDMWLNPGDTADLGDGETFVVDSLTYTISPRLALMEVAEVEA